jgi:hypothetical protein
LVRALNHAATLQYRRYASNIGSPVTFPSLRCSGAITALVLLPAFALVGCSRTEPPAQAGACKVPAATIPFRFASDGQRFGGFIDMPQGPGPHPAVMLLPDAGPTDVTRGQGEFARLRAALRAAGVASVVWDKAGNGCSSGRYRGIADLYRRADQVLAAAEQLGVRPDIDAGRIGVWAIGEGAWVAPMAATRTNALKFLIVVGAPGGDPVHQQLYLARRNLELEGYPAEARSQWLAHMSRALRLIRTPGNYRDFRRAVDPLLSQALFAKLEAFGVELNPSEARFGVLQSSAAFRVDAGVYWPAVEVPVLAFYGDKDSQFDWQEGARVLRGAFAGRAGASLTVRILKGADHRLCKTTTGGIDALRGGGDCDFASGYLDTLVAWLRRRGLTGS